MKIFNKKYIIAIALIFWAGILYSQDGYTISNELKDNVVRIKTVYADDSDDDNGFGIIISETGNKLYIITADHVVNNNIPEREISINFYSQQAYDIRATYLRGDADIDLALLEVEKPRNFNWKKNCLANAPSLNDDVWFIGKESEWEVPTSAENGSISNISLYDYKITTIFTSESIENGTSGAPLLNKYGIIGLIIENASRETTAIDIQTIKSIVTSDWNYPWQLETYSENYIETLANGFSFEMIAVEGGTFRMGSNNGDNDEKPRHYVVLDDFYIGKLEVTQKLWIAVMGKNPSFFNNCEDCPVEQVSWEDTQTFLQELSAITNREYRLPTEAQWEFAARGGNKNRNHRYSGSTVLARVAWYNRNSGNNTTKTGRKKPNELGIYDMSGNVWEWCEDWYDKDAYSKNNITTNPKNTTVSMYRVFRGGSWSYSSQNCRVANRLSNYPNFHSKDLGFRVVMILP